MNYEHIAHVAHEANRAYCESIGDMSQPPWLEAPDWQRLSAINGVAFHLNRLRNGIEPDPAESHESWLKQKVAEGWTYGPIKDPENKQHPCCVPYNQLPREQRLKDFLFGAIVRSFFMAAQVGKRYFVIGTAPQAAGTSVSILRGFDTRAEAEHLVKDISLRAPAGKIPDLRIEEVTDEPAELG